jgi:hypothetical protein
MKVEVPGWSGKMTVVLQKILVPVELKTFLVFRGVFLYLLKSSPFAGLKVQDGDLAKETRSRPLIYS